jgi:quaternary ammonium compound-resistance protein SugE
MGWLILVLAGLFEVGWAVGLKMSDGLSKLVPAAWTVVAMVISLWLLALALRTLPLGTAYAVWTGIGAVGTAAIGMIWFGDPATVLRIVSIVLIVAGIAGLKLASG